MRRKLKTPLLAASLTAFLGLGLHQVQAKDITLHALMEDVPETHIIESMLPEFQKETGIKVNYVQIPQATILDKEAIAQRAHSSDFDMYEGPTSLISQDIGLLGGVGLKPFESNSKLNVTGFSTNGMGELGDCTLNGTLYCLPVFVDGSVIAYNKNLLTKAGISTPPATWPA